MRPRLARAFQLGGLARELMTLRRDRPANPKKTQSVVTRLMRLHGLPQKIGQVLSLTELQGNVPLFDRLTETDPTMAAPEAFAALDAALGRPWQECFAELEPRGIGASLAQVHRGVLRDGRVVAVKIQYPHIAEALEMDLRALGWLTAPIGGLPRGFDLAGYRGEVGQMFQMETNFRQEATMLRRFYSAVAPLDNVEIPEVVDQYSNERVLTMTWVTGDRFSVARSWPTKSRREIAATLVRLFLTSCFSWRMLHADPHPGNYRFRCEPGPATVGLLDFGCVKVLDQETCAALAALIHDTMSGALRGNPVRARGHYEALGFQPLLLAPMQQLLPELSEILFEPFLRAQPFDLRLWHLGDRVESLLGPYRWNFRVAGPPELIFFMRAYQGLVQYLEALGAPVNWRTLYEEVPGRPAGNPRQPAVEEEEFAAAGAHGLHIRVSEQGCVKAEITFPASAAARLNELIPPELEGKLAERKIDVDRIGRDAASTRFAPGDLFHLDDAGKTFHVWLD